MDQLVTVNNQKETLITDIDFENSDYPGHNIPNIDEDQKRVIKEAMQKSHISPLTSISEHNSTEDEEEDEEEYESEKDDELLIPPHEVEKKDMPTVIDTFTTPNIYSNINNQQLIAELNEEVKELRKKVSKSHTMQSFLDKLNNKTDMSREIKFIQMYSSKKFQIEMTLSDFDSLSVDELMEIYKRVKSLSDSEKYNFIYKMAFDFALKHLQSFINTYFFSLSNLEKTLLYEDISMEIEEMMGEIEKNTIGKYVGKGNPITKVIFMVVVKICQAKIKG